MDNAAFEIPLNTLIECLNIFGTAGPASTNSSAGKYKKWRKAGDDSDHDDGDEGRARGGRSNGANNSGVGARGIESYFGGSEKRTGMRMTYAGAGYPLTLLM